MDKSDIDNYAYFQEVWTSPKRYALVKNEFRDGYAIVDVADGLFCREIDGLFCRSSPDIIVGAGAFCHIREGDGWSHPLLSGIQETSPSRTSCTIRSSIMARRFWYA